MQTLDKKVLFKNLMFLLCLISSALSMNALGADDLNFSGGCDPGRSSTLSPRSDFLFSAISYCEGGDAAKERISITLPAKKLAKFDFYSAGHADGKGVRLELVDMEGRHIKIPVYITGESWSPLSVHLPADWPQTGRITITMIDDSDAWASWAGISIAKRSATTYYFSNYALFLAKTGLILIIIFLPGLAWKTARTDLSAGLVPLPGMLLLTLAGLAMWVLPAGSTNLIKNLLQFAYVIIFIFLAFKYLRGVKSNTKVFCENGCWTPILLFLLVFLQALAVGINPLPIAQEIRSNGQMPGRMIASPPDHGIPFQTARYMNHHYDGIQNSKEYFGDWTVTSRGPLVPLGINSLFSLFNVQSEPPAHAEDMKAWPTPSTGEDVARIYGWILNALVILGAFELLNRLKVSKSKRNLALAWLSLSPLVIINTVYLWPKLLATYFFLLAIASIINRRNFIAGTLMGLAWLSHPVGALMIPAVGLFVLFRKPLTWHVYQYKEGFRSGTVYVIGIAVCMLPWLLYKLHLGYSDAFLSYVLAGGHGTDRAASLVDWLYSRASNFWLTLSPGAFFYSKYMHEWLYGALSDPLRWSIQYAKTLPGGLGLSCFILAYSALISDPLTRLHANIRNYILIAGFFVMIVFWGYSSDGLGRNSLEPVTALIIVFSVASLKNLKPLYFLIPLLAIEGQWLLISGFIYAKNFSLLDIKIDGWLALIISVIASVLITMTAYKDRRAVD